MNDPYICYATSIWDYYGKYLKSYLISEQELIKKDIRKLIKLWRTYNITNPSKISIDLYYETKKKFLENGHENIYEGYE